MFGKVNEGIHSYRLFDLAIADIIITLFGAYLIQYVFFPTISFVFISIPLFLLGIVCHRIFGVRTTVDKMLF